VAAKVKKVGRNARLAEAAPTVLAQRLAAVRAHEAAVLESPPEGEGVHAMRVATRRLRAALQLFGAPRGLSDELKQLQDALGAVRDAQLHPRWLGGELPARTSALHAAVRSFRARTAPWLAKLALAPRGRLGGHRMRKELRRKLGAVERLVAAGALDPREAHRLRIAVKKLRYFAELLRRALRLDGLLEELLPLQEALGDLRDLDVRRELQPGSAGAQREAKAAAVARVLARWRERKLSRSFRQALR
jgi:CHAD domain-containing protein